MGAQIVEIAGQKMAMLPFEDYQRLLELAEDRADILAADRAEERRLAGEEYVPADVVKRILSGDSPLRVWREYRGMSQLDLAKASGVSNNMISDMEHGKREGKLETLRALADALKVSLEDIVPD
jgi:DNA-binding XRE family transcriptional regulator